MGELQVNNLSSSNDEIRKLVFSSKNFGPIPSNLFKIKEDTLSDYKFFGGYGKYVYVYHNKIKNPQHTHANIQIGRFVLNDEGEIIDCDNAHDNDLLIQFFLIARKSPFFKKFVKNKYGQKLGSQKVIQNAKKRCLELIQNANQEIIKENKVHARAVLFQKHFLDRMSLDIQNHEDVLSVSQSEIGRIDITDSRRYIETTGAGPCIILIGYNKNNQKVVLSHLDLCCDPIGTLSLINQNLSSEGENEYHVLGGDSSSIKTLVEINEWFEKNGISPKTFDVLNDVKSVIFDKITGEICNTKCYDRKPDNNMAIETMILQNRVMQCSFSGKKLLPVWTN